MEKCRELSLPVPETANTELCELVFCKFGQNFPINVVFND
jgi:hypothetical protein